MPFFSIITVSKNASQTIGITLDSIIEQTFTDYELIIVDGGSDDNTLQVVDNKADIIISETDNGVYDAMNKGLNVASGKLVHFLNAGDWYNTEKALEIVSNRFSENTHLFFSDVNIIDKNSVRLVKYPNKPGKMHLYLGTICHQACFFNRDILNKYGGFDINLKLAADYEWITRAIIKNKINMIHIDKPLVSYDFRGISSSEENKILLDLERKEVQRRNLPGYFRALADPMRYVFRKITGIDDEYS